MKCTKQLDGNMPNRLMFARSRGSGLLIISIVIAIMISSIAMSIVKVNQVSLNSYVNVKSMLQAQQYAEAEATIVKATAYSDLASHNRVEIQNSNGFESELVLSDEQDYSEGLKQKIVTVNVYRTTESLPRYSLNVLRTNAKVEVQSGVPIGTVIAWPVNSLPTGSGVWLECNGQNCSSYPKLVTVLGKNNVPDYRNKFLEGNTVAGTTIAAGLPNITGTFSAIRRGWGSGPSPTGAFSWSNWAGNLKGASSDDWGSTYTFNASKSNAIYGASSTVQPPAVTVKFLIRAD